MICSKCKNDKQEDQFCKDKYTPTGRSVYCKCCRRDYYLKDRQSNPEKYKERASEARGKNNEYFKRYNQERRRKNKERNSFGICREGSKYCASCKSKVPKTRFGKCVSQKDGLQVYCYDCVAIIKHNRRQDLRDNKFSVVEWKQKIAFYLSCCVYCGKFQENPVIEHFVPFSKGGSSNIRNLVPACKFCNSKKNNKDPYQWISETFGSDHWILNIGIKNG